MQEFIQVYDDNVELNITLGRYYPKELNIEDYYSEAILKFKSGDNGYIYAFSVLTCKVLKSLNIKFDLVISVLGSNELELGGNAPLFMMSSYISKYFKCDHAKDYVSQKYYRESLKNTGGFNDRYKILSDCIDISKNFKGKNILIIDDIMTTGATLSVYSEFIKAKNAAKVYFLTLGKTYHKGIFEWDIPNDYVFNQDKFEQYVIEYNDSKNSYFELYEKENKIKLINLVFPNKTIVLNKLFEKVFDRYKAENISLGRKFCKFIYNSILNISRIEYLFYRELLSIIDNDENNELYILDNTQTASAYFSIMDLLSSFEKFGMLNSKVLNDNKSKISINIILLQENKFRNNVLNELINIEKVILEELSWKFNFKIKVRFINNIDGYKYDFVISEDKYINAVFKKQFVFQVNKNEIDFKECKINNINKITTVLNSNIYDSINKISIKNISLSAYIFYESNTCCSFNINEYVIDDKFEFNRKSVEYFFFRFFGYPSFNDGQYKIINEVLRGNSILGILPTGGGKSACFQFPSFISDGLTLVISPLRSLMNDQVQNLKNKGFYFSEYIDNSCDEKTKKQIYQKLKEEKIKILYVAPERLLMESFCDELKKVLSLSKIKYLVIDEAHCVSEWGHDFRPSYLALKDFCIEIGSPSIIALTATASQKVQSDILKLLDIDEKNLLKNDTLDRPEISFEVVKVKGNNEKVSVVAEYIKNQLPSVLDFTNIENIHAQNSGLIFTIYANTDTEGLRDRSTEYISSKINKCFEKLRVAIKSEAYHSKLKNNKRSKIQQDYKENKIPILVATKGYGMGVDKPNIKYVIHFNAPASIEAYYQEGGRAGRNKTHAHAVVFYYPMLKECVELLHKDKIEKLPCVADNALKCKNSGKICDIAAQIKLYLNSPVSNIEKYIKELKKCYNELLNIKPAGVKIRYEPQNSNMIYEKILCDLKKTGLIRKYDIYKYLDDFKIMFNIYDIKQVPVRELEKRIKIIEKRLIEYKNMKINMLKTMQLYLENPSMCRRNFMLTYFGESNIQLVPCNFCDYDGIDNKKNKKKAEYIKLDTVLIDNLRIIFNQKFDLLKIVEFFNKLEDCSSFNQIRIKVMRYLEDYPYDKSALFILKLCNILIDKHIEKKEYLEIINVVDKNSENITAFFELLNKNDLLNCIAEILILDNNITNYSNDILKVKKLKLKNKYIDILKVYTKISIIKRDLNVLESDIDNIIDRSEEIKKLIESSIKISR